MRVNRTRQSDLFVLRGNLYLRLVDQDENGNEAIKWYRRNANAEKDRFFRCSYVMEVRLNHQHESMTTEV